jgi:GntR family transcriptional regulator
MQLRDVLIGRIASGQWKPGDAIPNEAELSKEFGLSPGTVRKALTWMEEARIIDRQQGRGTYVRDPSSEEFVNWYERLRHEDGVPVRDVIANFEAVEVEASEEEAKRLQLMPGSLVRRSQRHRLDGGVPYMIEMSTVPASLFPVPLSDLRSDMTLLQLAKLCNVVLGGGEERVTAITATPQIAETLSCREGEPLLRLDRVIYTIKGRPAKWRVGFCLMREKYYSASIGRADA